MGLAKKNESEALRAHNSYWEYYLNGNLNRMTTLLDKEYTQVGSAETEV